MVDSEKATSTILSAEAFEKLIQDWLDNRFDDSTVNPDRLPSVVSGAYRAAVDRIAALRAELRAGWEWHGHWNDCSYCGELLEDLGEASTG